MKHVLSIAGSDCSGGAGIQADLKTFSALGVYGMTAISAITAQNTLGVHAVTHIAPDLLVAQIQAIFEDIRVDAVKIGMLGTAENILAVAECLRKYRPPCVVLDPVMVSKSGNRLLDEEASAALISELLPLADLVTPNLPEATVLSGFPISFPDEMIAAGRVILSQGARAVLIKGGHLIGNPDDILVFEGGQKTFRGSRVPSIHTHGTGCSLSSALAVAFAKGDQLEQAVAFAKDWVRQGIEHGLAIGRGIGPLHHFHAWWPEVES